MYTLSPIGYPIALLLDYMLGTYHDKPFSREGLKTLIMLHGVPRCTPQNAERLHPEEASTICNFLSLSSTPVLEAMSPMKDVFALTADTLLDEMTRYRILKSGHGRIPVYGEESKESVVGVLNVRSLIGLDFQEQKAKVGEVWLEELRTLGPRAHLADAMALLRNQDAEMVVVTDNGSGAGKALGILTFRDVMAMCPETRDADAAYSGRSLEDRKRAKTPEALLTI
jgi:metal transporter CNNM